jgi:hypothetical protein
LSGQITLTLKKGSLYIDCGNYPYEMNMNLRPPRIDDPQLQCFEYAPHQPMQCQPLQNHTIIQPLNNTGDFTQNYT